jgi:hypothetical protein
LADNQGMSDTVILALITALSAVATAFIARYDRHQLADRAALQLAAQTTHLVSAQAPSVLCARVLQPR